MLFLPLIEFLYRQTVEHVGWDHVFRQGEFCLCFCIWVQVQGLAPGRGIRVGGVPRVAPSQQATEKHEWKKVFAYLELTPGDNWRSLRLVLMILGAAVTG